ncbi:MAG: circularly permuted type 2 ATP-grasp protein, partial [Desulfurococcales archaeon]|nr:circularly permuted type 2 ATP-grasp protein [Desulfurococcales archaeon]
MTGGILSWRSIHINYPDRYNEVIDEDLKPRPEYEAFFENLINMGTQKFSEEVRNASIIAFLEGFTFNIEPGQYRPIPMDFIPRIVRRKAFNHIAVGLKQRAIALNKLLQDIYSGEKTIVPDEVIYGSKYFYPDLVGLMPRHGIFIHVYGADLLFDGTEFKIIEDNLRVPSGVAYQLKIRELGGRFLPQLREGYRIADYRPWEHLKKAMRDASWARDPFMVLLSDGPYDSAYFEHRYLANLLGIPLVEGSDLRVDERGYVVLRLPGEGEVQVDVIYRRIEDLDIFVPGLSKAYADGKVALVNAWGTGVADDKLVYHYIPQVIREYLGEDPIIPQP